MKSFKFLTTLFLLCYCSILFSQEKKKQITISGNLGIFLDVYNYSEKNYPTFRPKYPDNELRFNANATLQIGKYLSIPFGLSISNRKTLYNLPSLPEENFVDFIQNPKNNISINPRYKWIKGYIGTQTPNYSTLTTGDITMFGIGVDINPSKFIFSFNYGLSQRAIESDAFLNIVGAYKQRIVATRIGYGKIDGPKVTLNFVKIKDDVNSVVNAPLYDTPIEGITIAPLVELKIKKNFTFKTETAASIFTSNLNNSFSLNNNAIESLKSFITINASSKADFSHVSSLDWKTKKITIGGEIKYIGPGFVPAGYRYIEKDIIDYKLKTNFKLFKNKTNVNGMFGIRKNNVQNTNLQSTKRVISNINVFSQFSKAFSLNVNYSNFGFNNNEINNVIRVEMTNNSISIAPSYNFSTKKINHIINANLGLNSFDQFDAVSNGFVATNSKNFSLNYNMMFKQMPLNINFIGIVFKNTMPSSTLKLSNYGTTFSYKFFDKKLSPSIGFNLANITRDNFTTDHRFGIKLKSKYKINKKLQFKFSYRLNNYKYGSSRPNAITNENRFQFALLQNF